MLGNQISPKRVDTSYKTSCKVTSTQSIIPEKTVTDNFSFTPSITFVVGLSLQSAPADWWCLHRIHETEDSSAYTSSFISTYSAPLELCSVVSPPRSTSFHVYNTLAVNLVSVGSSHTGPFSHLQRIQLGNQRCMYSASHGNAGIASHDSIPLLGQNP